MALKIWSEGLEKVKGLHLLRLYLMSFIVGKDQPNFWSILISRLLFQIPMFEKNKLKKYKCKASSALTMGNLLFFYMTILAGWHFEITEVVQGQFLR